MIFKPHSSSNTGLSLEKQSTETDLHCHHLQKFLKHYVSWASTEPKRYKEKKKKLNYRSMRTVVNQKLIHGFNQQVRLLSANY